MKLSQDIRPVTDLKTSPARLLKQVGETRRPIVITQNGEAQAVMVDISTWEEMREAIAMMRLITLAEEETGKPVPHEQAMQRVRRKLTGR